MRLPDGGYTEDSVVYGRAWKDLGEKAERYFPSFRVMGYDPMIRMTKRNPTASDAWRTITFDLTPEAVMDLTSPK